MKKTVLWTDLIKIAREDIAKSGEIGRGKLRGPGASIAIVLFADEFNKIYKTTDNTLFQFIESNKKEFHDSITDINFLFRNYNDLLKHQKKPADKDPKNKVNNIQYQWWWEARNGNLHSWIYFRVLHFLYKMDYDKYKKGGVISAKKYEAIKNWVSERAHKIHASNPTLSKYAIATKVTGEYKNKEWEHPLKEYSEQQTIYNWLRADKSF